MTFAATVNKRCNDFKLSDLTVDDFKCLIFALGLVPAEDAEIRRRVLSKIENEKKLAEDCQWVVYVKSHSKTIEESRIAHIKKIKRKPTLYSTQEKKSKIMRPNIYDKQSTNRRENPPLGQCYICGDLHWIRFYPAKKKLTYKNCGKGGHEVTRCWYAIKVWK